MTIESDFPAYANICVRTCLFSVFMERLKRLKRTGTIRSDMMTRTRMKVHNRILHLNRVCQYLFDCRAASRRNWPPLLSRISIHTTAMYW